MMITRDDIERWLEDFDTAKRIVKHLNISEDDRREVLGRLNDGIYLTTLVESLMVLEEPEGTIARAKKRMGK